MSKNDRTEARIVKYISFLKRLFPVEAQMRLGGIKFWSFVFFDGICVVLSNLISFDLYLEKQPLKYENHEAVMIAMLVIDIFVTLAFNTLDKVLRRGIKQELIRSFKHVLLCFVTLCMLLFSSKLGSTYSRVTVYLTHVLFFCFICITHTIWKKILLNYDRKNKNTTALVMTTNSFVKEAIDSMKEREIEINDIYLLRNNGKESISGIPIVNNAEEASAAICWERIDKVFIYGLDGQAVPDVFIEYCQGMGIEVELVDFDYKLIDIKTICHENPQYGKLSFLESRRDIPFRIRRVYWITETDAEMHRGFHAHKLNCQLLFCPYGAIDIILDDGEKRNTVILDDPDKGLILMPGLWREMVWKKKDSVLCVLASEYYDANEYIRDYNEFIKYSKQIEE